MTVRAPDQLPPIDVADARLSAALASRVKLVGFDVDGVLTDGGVYLGATRDGDKSLPFELKRYDIQDGLGMAMLRESGLRVVIITGRVSESVAQRARELRVDACIQDPEARKLPALTKLCEEYGCTMDEVAFVGDDLPDLGVLRAVGLPVAVGNAVPEVRRTATLQLVKHGGRGAVREFAELLLRARGTWTDTVERYVASRSVAGAPQPTMAVTQ